MSTEPKMTLADFAKSAGITLETCGPEWGGLWAFRDIDAPNCRWCGYRTEKSAIRRALEEKFGKAGLKAIEKLLKRCAEKP